MVGMQMGVHRLDQPEVEFLHQLQVAVHLFQHRVDDQRLAAAAAGEQVAVGAGYAVEQLPEDHRLFPRLVIVPGRRLKRRHP